MQDDDQRTGLSPTPSGEIALDVAVADAERFELRASYHAVLCRGESGQTVDRGVDGDHGRMVTPAAAARAALAVVVDSSSPERQICQGAATPRELTRS